MYLANNGVSGSVLTFYVNLILDFVFEEGFFVFPSSVCTTSFLEGSEYVEGLLPYVVPPDALIRALDLLQFLF